MPPATTSLLCCSLCGVAALAASPSLHSSTPISPFSPGSQSRSTPPRALAEGPWQPSSLSLRARRWLYATLEPLDKGDFRWEFLVPWTKKTLTTLDKFIVCSTFIGLSFVLQTWLEPGASVGVHLSYIAQFFSYAMGDPIGFRLLAVLTSVLEIGGNLFETKEAGLIVNGADFDLSNAFASVDAEDVFPIFYDQLFIVINVYYILRWLLTQEVLASALEWSEGEEGLYTICFAPLGFRRAQFSQLLRVATLVSVSETEADVLTVQGEPIYDLFVPLNGTVEVRVGGTVTTTLPPYQLIGEASLLENLQSKRGEVHPPARASVVAAPGSSYMRWPFAAFYELQQQEDSDFAYAIQLMIARTLSAKLSAARLSQRESERRLKDRMQTMRGGRSPMALAAKRLEGQAAGEAAEGRGGSVFGGSAAEVEALLRQNREKEAQLQGLQRSLAEVKTELAEVRARIILLVVSIVVLLVGTGIATSTLPTEWWGQSFTELAATELLHMN